MNEWVPVASFLVMIVLTIFNAGFYFNIRSFNEWRVRVDKTLEPLNGLSAWKTNIETRQDDLKDRMEYVHGESKKRDDGLWSHLDGSLERIDRTYVRKKEA